MKNKYIQEPKIDISENKTGSLILKLNIPN